MVVSFVDLPLSYNCLPLMTYDVSLDDTRRNFTRAHVVVETYVFDFMNQVNWNHSLDKLDANVIRSTPG